MHRITIEKTLDVNYNLDYLVIVPQKDIELLDAFEYTFGNILLFNNTVDDVEFLIKFLRKNLVGQIVFVDYYAEYNEIINTLVDEHKIKFIFTKCLGELSDELSLGDFNCICDKYDCGLIDEIGFLDYGLYKTMKNKRHNVKYVMLDIPNESVDVIGDNSIGILNTDNSNYDSFYNELCCLTFLPEFDVKILNPNKTTMNFAKSYGIHVKNAKNFRQLVTNNVCNLDVNFAGALAIKFIRSMDVGVLCIVGNNSFLSDSYPVLCGYLVVESDDDINEIANKIKEAIANREYIFDEYNNFRMEYSKKAKDLASKFLGCGTDVHSEGKYEKALTVVVPVYNTEKYLSRCLDSIIEAKIPGMEILVINDGSTDGSGDVVKEFLGKYPDLIRYIEQSNHGLGNVRNVGLMQARGKYLASVDSDDTVESGFFKSALSYMNSDVDVIICDWMSVGEEKEFETAALDWVFRERKEIEGLLYTTIMPSTCNKIMKKSLFFDNNINYLEQKYEDLSANPLALLKAKTVKYIRKPYYNYFLRDCSLMRSVINPKQMVDVLKFLDAKLNMQKFNTMNMKEFRYFTYSWRIEEYIINPLYDLNAKELDEAVEYIYRNAYSLIDSVFNSEYYKKMLGGLKSRALCNFVRERNDMFCDKKLKEFIARTKKPKKITAAIIYYGDN